jgi:hypothetical protein
VAAWGESLLLCFLLFMLLWWWRDSARAREVASASARTLCGHEGVQFLDGTAALARLGLVRSFGGLRVKRTFDFAYSETGEDRQKGSVTLIGNVVNAFVLRGRATLEVE